MAPGAYTQGIILSVVTALLPGTAWNGMLGLATNDDLTQAKHIGGGILYVLFALSSLVAPIIVNKFGPRVSLCLGGSTYVLFCVALLLSAVYDAIPPVLVTVAMSLVGVGAGILWTAQGMMTLSFPTQAEKGKYQTTFWVIFNLSATLLGIYTWLSSKDQTSGSGTVSGATWWVLCIMAFIGLALIAALSPLETVVRSDGTICQAPENKPLSEELSGMLKVMMDKRVIALFPLFLYSNWFYAYELTSFAGVVFDGGASGLSSTIFWGSQMIGAKCLDAVLVYGNMSARTRAFVSITLCFVLIAISWVWGFWANSHYHADEANAAGDDWERMAWNDSQAPMAYALMGLWGFCDALVQNWVYWIVAQLYRNPADMARMIGVYKSFQSIASSISFFIGSSLNPSGQLWLIVGLFLSTIPGSYYLCNSIKSEPEDAEKLVAK